MRSPELHPLLQGTPSLASRHSSTIRHLAELANVIVELIERLKGIEPELRADCPDGPDAHLRHVDYGRYREASDLITNYGVPRR